MPTNINKWLKISAEIQAIAQAGLTYTENAFDKERFIRLRAIAAELLAELSQNPLHDLTEILTLEKGYTTPKLDVRSFIIKEDKILLVKEIADGLWSLPGGWVDVNESPSESIIRETKEETGYDISVIKLLALWDKLKHDHPPQWPHVYKALFHCEIIGGEPMENIEVSELQFFDMDNLPPLSTHRITATQINRLRELVANCQPTEFD
ncbi:MAG: NUDIX hydrolase [Tatlockia sp.]|nr:NUDIX hydrolase [Tatlockia sp.]